MRKCLPNTQVVLLSKIIFPEKSAKNTYFSSQFNPTSALLWASQATLVCSRTPSFFPLNIKRKTCTQGKASIKLIISTVSIKDILEWDWLFPWRERLSRLPGAFGVPAGIPVKVQLLTAFLRSLPMSTWEKINIYRCFRKKALTWSVFWKELWNPQSFETPTLETAILSVLEIDNK